MLIGDPGLVHGRDRVAAADDRDGVRRRHRLRDRERARPRTAPARTRPSGRSRRSCGRPPAGARRPPTSRGPMSRPIQPSGIASAATTRVGASASTRSAMTTSLGQHELAAALAGVGHRPPGDLLALGVLVLRRADGDAARRQEREGHGAADQHRIGEAREAVDDADLVGHLRPADHDDERVLGALEDAGERLELGRQEQPGRARQEVRHADRRRVRAVHGAERVAHEEVGERRELGARTPGRSVSSRGSKRRFSSRRTGASPRRRTRPARRGSSAQAIGDRAAARAPGRQLALRAAEVRADDHRPRRARAGSESSAATPGCACRR